MNIKAKIANSIYKMFNLIIKLIKKDLKNLDETVEKDSISDTKFKDKLIEIEKIYIRIYSLINSIEKNNIFLFLAPQIIFLFRLGFAGTDRSKSFRARDSNLVFYHVGVTTT